MANSIVFQLPMGIKCSDGSWTKEVELVETTGAEEDILADTSTEPGKKNVFLKPYSEKVTEVLSRCTVRIGKDCRPDGETRFSKPLFFKSHWEKAFTNDRGLALIRLRQVSLGDVFSFPSVCPTCGTKFKSISYDLSEIEVSSTDLSVLEGNDGKYTSVTPSGKVVVWRPLIAKDEDALKDIISKRKSDTLSAIIQLKLLSIDGKDVKFHDVQSLSSKDRAFLRGEFDSKESGPDTDVAIVCNNPDCEVEFVQSLPVGSKDFFFPSGA